MRLYAPLHLKEINTKMKNVVTILKHIGMATLYAGIGFAIIQMIPGAKDILKKYVLGA